MLVDDEVSGDLLAAETGVALVAVRRFGVEFAVKVVERWFCYVNAPARLTETNKNNKWT